MEPISLALHAMNTRFELVLHGDDPVALRAAGEEALGEIARWEDALSLFRPSSEIASLNARAAHEPVRLSPEVFGLLQHALQLSTLTGGAFDVTVGPLMRCWGFHGGTGRVPSATALAEARACIGAHLVELDARNRTVRFSRPGVSVDLGAIGKGFAIERAVELLREAGVTCALLHGGTSTTYALGAPDGQSAWPVAVDGPPQWRGPTGTVLAVVPLRDRALSVSATWGRTFKSEGREFGHVLNPESGLPLPRAGLAAVLLASPTDADALSTALMTLGGEDLARVDSQYPDLRWLRLTDRDGRWCAEAHGLDPMDPGSGRAGGQEKTR